MTFNLDTIWVTIVAGAIVIALGFWAKAKLTEETPDHVPTKIQLVWETIISQVLLGLSHAKCVQVQADRGKAIAETIAQAAARDVILIAGKGHEPYQEIAGKKNPFDDRAEAAKALGAKA